MKSAKNKQNKKKQSKLSTNGEMKSSLPAAFTIKTRTLAPKLFNRPDGCRVSHRELVGAVNRSVAYTVSGFEINPGIQANFPWLSHIAKNYESYRFVKLRYIYEPVVGTSNNGMVMLTVDYDASDPYPGSELDFMAYAGSVQGPIYSSLVLDCPTKRMRSLSGQLYTRWTALPANQDIKTYDVGKFALGTSGGADATRCGSLYVEYVIDLFTPGVPQSEEEFETSAKVIGAGGNVAKATPFGDAGAITQGLTQPVYSAAGSTLTFKEAGEYMLKTTITGTGLVGADAVTIGGSVPTVTRSDTLAKADGTSMWETYFIKVLEPLQTLTMAYNLATTVSGLGLYVSPFKYANR